MAYLLCTVACFTLLLLWLITRARAAYFEASTAAIHRQAHAIYHFGRSSRADTGHRHAVRPAQSGNEAKARPKAGGDFRDAGCTKVPGLLQAEPTERGRTSS